MNDGPCEPKREARIPALQVQQIKLIDELHQVICKLDSKLHPVLRQEPGVKPQPCAEPLKPDTVYGHLEQSNGGIQCSIKRIDNLIDHLEI